jgi:hypothetical protein
MQLVPGKSGLVSLLKFSGPVFSKVTFVNALFSENRSAKIQVFFVFQKISIQFLVHLSFNRLNIILRCCAFCLFL